MSVKEQKNFVWTHEFCHLSALITGRRRGIHMWSRASDFSSLSKDFASFMYYLLEYANGYQSNIDGGRYLLRPNFFLAK